MNMAENKDKESATNDTRSWKSFLPNWSANVTDLTLYKVFYFFFYGSNGAIFPYLPVYFKQMGLLASHVGMLTGFRPLIQCLGAPFWGIMADKYQIRKGILLFGLVAWLLKTMLILVVQPHEQTCQIITKYQNTTLKETTPIHRRSLEDYNSVNKSSEFTTHTGNYGMLNSTTLFPGEMPANKKENERIIRNNPHKGTAGNPYKIVTKIIKSEERKITYIRSNSKDEVIWIFTALLVLIIIGEFMESPSITLADASLLNQLKESKHSYGGVRMWGSLGFSLTSFLVGYLLHTTSELICGQTFEDYTLAFYFFAGFVSLALFTVTFIQCSYETDEKTPTTQGLASLFLNFHCCSLLIIVFHLGFCHGFVINFINWYLDNLGASTFLMGFSMCFRHVSDVVTFFMGETLIKYIGHINIIKICLLLYAVGLGCYSFLVNPWWVIPLEVMLGASYAASWTACVSYFGSSAPPGAIATVQGILQGVYWGLGLGIGAIAGGFLIHAYGEVTSFRIYAVATFFVLLYFLAVDWINNRCFKTSYTRLSQDGKQNEKEKDDNGNNQEKKEKEQPSEKQNQNEDKSLDDG